MAKPAAMDRLAGEDRVPPSGQLRTAHVTTGAANDADQPRHVPGGAASCISCSAAGG